MATTISSTALDFNAIKNNLKVYFQKQQQFADYDFEASGLSNILDVLAYNTHINGLIANMSLNESFLNTAQLRSSVVSIATGLGYIPFSKTASRGVIQCVLDLQTAVNRPATIDLPRYTEFTATVDDVTYTFRTLQTYTATDDGNGIYQFLNDDGNPNLDIYEGTLVNKTFIVGEGANTDVYIIPDVNMDTSTISVNVYDTYSSDVYTPYTNIINAVSVTENSTLYILKETPNEYYQLSFGSNNILGRQPESGNAIRIEYLKTNGSDANSATGFVTEDTIFVNNVSYPITTTTISRSFGGKEKEQIESIRRAAPYQYAAQNRMVTPEDYSTLIRRRFPTVIDDLKSWGGEDNPDPKFGTVFSSIQFSSGVTATQQATIKNEIRDLVEQLGIISFRVEFTDPQDTYIENDVYYQVNPALTPITINTLNNQVRETISGYYNNTIGGFDQSFRRSNLLSLVDDISPAILSSRAEIRMQQRFTPVLNAENSHTFTFPTALRTPANNTEQVVTSNSFSLIGLDNQDKTCVIKNQGTTLQVVEPSTNTVILNNIGSIQPLQNTVKIITLKPVAILGGGTEIKLSVIPANESAITPDRNNILKYDADRSSVNPVITRATN